MSDIHCKLSTHTNHSHEIIRVKQFVKELPTNVHKNSGIAGTLTPIFFHSSQLLTEDFVEDVGIAIHVHSEHLQPPRL
jgi:hypothetical protein